MKLASSLYCGTVFHKRLRPKPHKLRYRVFSLLLDLDELPDLDRRFRLFGYNRFAPLAFHDADHGAADGSPLRPWVEQRLDEAGLNPDGGPIRLLCYPRIFGYVFNPLSVYFCYRRDGGLTAILYEVCNTFGERHTYVIPAPDSPAGIVSQRCRKALYVSPFIGMEAEYQFRIRPPGGDVAVIIHEGDSGGPLLIASFHGERTPITGTALASILARFPLLTLKVMAAIHWEALRLWLKGTRPHRHVPAAAPVQSSVWLADSRET